VRVVTITGEFTDTLPLTVKPGPMMGVTRGNFMRNLFSLATTYGADVRVAGEHWDTPKPSPRAVKLASEKLGKPEVQRIQRSMANVPPWLGAR
jgi:hypothetical protein